MASPRPGGFYRVFYRVEAGRRDDRRERARRFGLHARQHMLIRRHREPRRRVSEALADDLDRYAGLEEQRGVGVAEVVKPEARGRRVRDQPGEDLREPVRVHRAARRAAEDMVVVADGSTELSREGVAPAGEDRHGDIVEVDPASRVPSLAARLVELVADQISARFT